MQLAFYIAEKGNYQDKLISWWTRGPYSHVEIIFPNGDWFSSSTRDNGVRFKKIMPSPHNWHYQNLQLDESLINEIYTWCETQVGKPYDWFGAFGVGIKIPTKNLSDSKSKWFCSEICSNPLIRNNTINISTDQISPNYLWRYLTNTVKAV